ncbi:hypothetical protein QKT07_gp2 [Hymenopteran rhabdo-related virus]|uniref:Uncharacterized protein n=1 Tax=Hymenopteran rhabdo-related virus 46 TaxID=2847807 RepID=A0AAE9GYQ7_9RHAB|nr:hypothetical protein QKT07_gp2 [Hymenopteran rhabdo-related virus]UOS86048.1 hypothetical protein [Hymenopteran rhabdo-related virus 46]
MSLEKVKITDDLYQMLNSAPDRMPPPPFSQFLDDDDPGRMRGGSDRGRSLLPTATGGAIPKKTSKSKEAHPNPCNYGSPAYMEMINDVDFLELPVNEAIKRILDVVANSKHPSEVELWTTYSATILTWQEEKEAILLELVVRHALKGAEGLCVFIEGALAGIQSARAKEHHRTTDTLALMIEQLTLETKALREEKVAHMRQVDQFVTQVNNAATNINTAMRAVESHHLTLVKSETTRAPPSTPSPHLFYKSSQPRQPPPTEPSDQSEEDASLPASAVPVPSIKEEGTYIAEGVVIKLTKSGLSFVSYQRPGFAPLSKAVKMPLKGAAILLNKNLHELEELGLKKPNWADFLSGDCTEKGKRLKEIIQGMTIGNFQWKKVLDEQALLLDT